jgi:hypothetical protein
VPFFVPTQRKSTSSLNDKMKYSQKGAQCSFGAQGYSFDGFNSKLSSYIYYEIRRETGFFLYVEVDRLLGEAVSFSSLIRV